MAAKSYLMSIAYDGRDFSGYQYQDGLRTVQGELEEVLSHLFKHRITTKASGRTDAGVHALDQVVAFIAPELMDLDRLAYVLGRFFPRDIKLNWINYSKIHPRFDALAKVYSYRCNFEDELFARPYSLFIKEKLDFRAVELAASYLVGEHDFYNFSNRRGEEKSTIRTIYRIYIRRKKDGFDLVFVGNGFLYKMVRIMAQYLINIGLGNYPAEATPRVLEKRDRLETRQVAPSQALFLERVFYEEVDLKNYLKNTQI